MILNLICAAMSLGAAISTASSVATLGDAMKALEAERALDRDLAESRRETIRTQAENVRLVHEMNKALRKGE